MGLHFFLCFQDEVRRQTTLTLLGAVAQSRKGRDMVWNYVKSNWDEFHKKYVSVVSSFCILLYSMV